MSDEIKTEEKETKCFCQNKSFREILKIALGTFIGVFCALSLFAALHKPPMMHPHPFAMQGGMRKGCPCKMIHYHVKPDKPKFEHTDKKHPAPFETQREFEKD